MPAKKKPFTKMQCEQCKEINYFIHKSKKATEEGKLSLQKYCNSCKKHTAHKETK